MAEQTMLEMLADNIHKAREEMKKHGETAVKNYFKSIFDSDLKLVAIRWPQYIPGFNDGDPCVFTMGEIECLYDKALDHGDERDGFLVSYEMYDGYTIHAQEEKPEVPDDSFLNSFEAFTYKNGHQESLGIRWQEYTHVHPFYPTFFRVCQDLNNVSELLEQCFGYDLMITVTRDEIITEHYDCGY